MKFINNRIQKIIKLFISLLVILFVVYSISNNRNEKKRSHQLINKSHVTYIHYLDTDDRLIVENFIFFIKHAYAACSDEIYFTFVFLQKIENQYRDQLIRILGKDAAYKLFECTEGATKNTRMISRVIKNQPNACYYSGVLKNELNTEIAKRSFSYFFFIKSSALGPFLPSYWYSTW